MSALSDHLDSIKFLQSPAVPVVDVAIAMGGGPTVAVNIQIIFDADNSVELWNFDILQFRGNLNDSVTDHPGINRIQWSFGTRGFSFSKVAGDPDALWSVELDEIEGRGETPEDALVALLG